MSRLCFVVVPLLLLTSSCGSAHRSPETAEVQSAPTPSPSPESKAQNDSESSAPISKTIAPGSRVSLWLPEGMRRLGRAFVYRNSNSNLVVALAELTATEDEASKLVSGVIGGAEGLEKTSDETEGSLRRVLLSGKKTDRDARMLILEDGGRAATVYVLFSPGYASQAEKILDSVKLDPAAPLDPLELHGLSLGSLGGMEIGNATHQPVVLTRKDQKPPIPKSSAIAFISINPHNYGDAITEEQLGALLGTNIANLNPDLENAKVNEVEISGHKAHELLLQGQKDGTPLAIYAYAIPDGDCAVIAVAYVQMDHADQEMADVVPLLRSLELGDI